MAQRLDRSRVSEALHKYQDLVRAKAALEAADKAWMDALKGMTRRECHEAELAAGQWYDRWLLGEEGGEQ